MVTVLVVLLAVKIASCVALFVASAVGVTAELHRQWETRRRANVAAVAAFAVFAVALAGSVFTVVHAVVTRALS